MPTGRDDVRSDDVRSLGKTGSHGQTGKRLPWRFPRCPIDLSMRHHNPAWWPPDDGFGRATPDDFVQPGVPIGTHDQKVSGVSFHICLEHFSDRAAVDFYHLKGRLGGT